MPRSAGFACLALLLGCTAPAHAHFPWLALSPEERPTEVKLYFGEEAAPDDPELLDNIKASEVFAVGGFRGEPKPISFKKGEWALEGTMPEGQSSSTVVLRLTYGVISREEEPFLLKYYAKAYPSALPGSWRAVEKPDLLPMEVTPRQDGDAVIFQVTMDGKPAADAQVVIAGPGLSEEVEGTTNEMGEFSTELPEAGQYSIRARVMEEKAGEHEGKAYNDVRHYSTLTLNYVPVQITSAPHDWPALQQGTTSFGAAAVDGWLYVYGGHYGKAHHYSQEGQSGDFRRLNLRQPEEWESLAGGPKLTGLAMVVHNGKLYRVGGFTATNTDDQEQSLWSQDDFARFDPATMQWEELPSLPEGRSSHDVAIVGDTLYVVGGWNMQGDEETVWHDTAWSVDLSADRLEWQPVTPPDFHRRAVAAAAWNDKLYVLGGMQDEGGTTTRVAVYDPATQEWSEGPALLGGGMEGFGAAAFATDGRLYATTMSGAVQQLAADGSQWKFVGQLEHPRFFHEMVAIGPGELVIVGGAHMSVGKIDELERLAVPATATAAR